MKQKMSISIEGDTVEVIEQKVKEGSFRNKSHLIEYAVGKFLESK